MLFNLDMYRVLKKTLHHFKYEAKEKFVGIEEFIQRLDTYFEESVIEKNQAVLSKYRTIKQRLENSARSSDQFNQLDVAFFSDMIDIIKNKQYEEGMDANHMRL